jgi:hypothetical protein
MGLFANGKYAIAICDRCGFQYDYHLLAKEWNGLRTCTECWEPKHPQLDPIYPPPEPQALVAPRPDVKEVMDVPVGDQIFPFIQNTTTQMVMQMGIVTVEIT